ncbi:TPA: hypothetical protein ACXP5C_004790 [Klebsiella pneumoniae]|uniref:hypothetical protein n=1 Tax=Klebsiella pneumoniae complex TaxID=3390273 RepID=UPI000D65246E|nr:MULTISPECIES: hypothetical protein [Klebsiella]THH65094.1 hypothetical protein E9152_03785 [Klebsiella pneumoniae subsp. pneumoniae]HBU8931796.1 hypothetical protein [Klebsiella pneumoniae]HBX2505075.1 hypothetical protein [Klebsiella pneumoniae]
MSEAKPQDNSTVKGYRAQSEKDTTFISMTNSIDSISSIFIDGIIPPEGSVLEMILVKKENLCGKCTIELKLRAILL